MSCIKNRSEPARTKNAGSYNSHNATWYHLMLKPPCLVNIYLCLSDFTQSVCNTGPLLKVPCGSVFKRGSTFCLCHVLFCICTSTQTLTNVAICQQKQWGRRLLASKHECKECFENALWGRKCAQHVCLQKPPQGAFNPNTEPWRTRCMKCFHRLSRISLDL